MFRLRLQSQTDRVDVPSQKKLNRRLIARVRTLQTQRAKIAEIQEYGPFIRHTRWKLPPVVRRTNSALRGKRTKPDIETYPVVASPTVKEWNKQKNLSGENKTVETVVANITKFLVLKNGLPDVPRELRKTWEVYLPIILSDPQLSRDLQFLLLPEVDDSRIRSFRERLECVVRKAQLEPAIGVFSLDQKPHDELDSVFGWFPNREVIKDSFNVFRIKFAQEIYVNSSINSTFRIELRSNDESVDIFPEGAVLKVPPRSQEYRDFLIKPKSEHVSSFDASILCGNEPVGGFRFEFSPSPK